MLRKPQGIGTSPRNPGKGGEESTMGKRVVIVGAGAAGGSVAAEARRGDPSLEIVLVEQRSQVSVAA